MIVGMSSIPALRREMQEDLCESVANLVYRASFRRDNAAQRNPVSKNRTKRNKTKNKKINCVKLIFKVL